MKLKKLLEINQMCEERKAPYLPFDIQESFEYESSSEGKDINILDMDIVHFVRAFKVLAKKPVVSKFADRSAIRPSKVALNLIAGKLHIAVNELEEYIG